MLSSVLTFSPCVRDSFLCPVLLREEIEGLTPVVSCMLTSVLCASLPIMFRSPQGRVVCAVSPIANVSCVDRAASRLCLRNFSLTLVLHLAPPGLCFACCYLFVLTE